MASPNVFKGYDVGHLDCLFSYWRYIPVFVNFYNAALGSSK